MLNNYGRDAFVAGRDVTINVNYRAGSQPESRSSPANTGLDSLLCVFPLRNHCGIQSIEWQPGGEVVAMGNGDGTVSFINVRDGSIRTATSGREIDGLIDDPVDHIIKWSADGTSLLSLPDMGAGAYPAIWRNDHGEWEADPIHDDFVFRVPDEAGWIGGQDPCALRGREVLNFRTGKTTVMALTYDSWQRPASFSPSMRFVAVCFPEEGEVQICEVSGGRLVRSLGGRGDRDCSVSWSGDGRYLAAADSEQVHIWDPMKEQLIGSVPIRGPLSGDIPFKVRYLRTPNPWSRRSHAVAIGGRIIEWLPDGTPREIINLGYEVNFVAWSDDSRVIAVGDSMEIWDTAGFP